MRVGPRHQRSMEMRDKHKQDIKNINKQSLGNVFQSVQKRKHLAHENQEINSPKYLRCASKASHIPRQRIEEESFSGHRQETQHPPYIPPPQEK